MIFTARYSSPCGVCGDRIEAGDAVTWDDDEDASVIHDYCLEAPAPVVRPVNVCSSCYLVHAGECF